MDFPDDPGLNMVGGRFADRDPNTSTPGSTIPAGSWANPVTDEMIALTVGAGLAPNKAAFTQVRDATQILARGGAFGFRAKPQGPATLSLDIEAGAFFSLDTRKVVTVVATTAGPIAAPGGNPRKDIVFIDAITGAVGITTGAENVAPVDPAIGDDKLPIARIKAYVGMTEIVAADIDELRHLNTLGASFVAPLTPEHISGLELSNNGADALKDIDIAAGAARDDADSVNMALSATLVKRLDASWAVGANAGGLDGTESVAGTPDAGTWYNAWLIKRTDTGVVDVLFSESATAPTMPASYDKKVRIGAVLFDGTPNLIPFLQKAHIFIWKAQVEDLDGAATNTRTLVALTVPTGISVRPIGRQNKAGASSDATLIQGPDETDAAVGANYNDANAGDSLDARTPFADTVRTNLSAQVAMRSSGAANSISVWTKGWEDPRGRSSI